MKRRIALMLSAGMLIALFSACAAPKSAQDLSPTEYFTQMNGVASECAPTEGFPDMNTEEYAYREENRFLSVANNPLSTFSADVDTASYANVRRMLTDGSGVVPDAVRIEEMVNYFHYDYPSPTDGSPFSVTTEIAPCPWNENTQLLLIGLQAVSPKTETLPASNLVFLIDVSGSMDEADKLPLVKRAFLLLTENLRAEDRISIVTYASSDSVVLSGASGADKKTIMDAIENLTAGGSTAGSKGITTAYALARENFIEDGNNRIILATDGDLNVGVTSEGELTRLVEKEREDGVFLSVMGFGTGNYKDNKLEALADNGNGNYSYIDSALEAKKVLIEEMGGTLFTVAKDVKLQIEFNPAIVKGYRLIGYENRLLNAEDFEDDTKDAGEIGAGHRVTALYEIAKTDSAQPIDGVDLKYQQSQPANSAEWLTVNIRYKEPTGTESQRITRPVDNSAVTQTMSRNMTLASAVAQFGMLLSESKYAGTATYATVEAQLKAIEGITEDPYTDELLYLVRQASRLG